MTLYSLNAIHHNTLFAETSIYVKPNLKWAEH
jgi:hypothetical protein